MSEGEADADLSTRWKKLTSTRMAKRQGHCCTNCPQNIGILLPIHPVGDAIPLELTPGFYVRHHHHGPGHLIIYPPVGTSTPARIEFTTVRNVPASENALKDPRDDPVKGHLVVQINDIVGLTKKGKSLPVRTALGWALDAEGAGGTGLEIKVVRRDMDEAVRPDPNEAGKEETPAHGKEQVIKLESIVRRNELFDRLIAIGDQRWEMN